MTRQVVLLAAVLAGFPAFAGRQPYERYKTIVGRQMFGPLPADFDPSKLPSEAKASRRGGEPLTEEQEKLKSAIHFSVINVTQGGTVKVGFTDRSEANNPKNYYLGVGETTGGGGWLVKEADPDAATMTIAKGEIEVTLKIGDDSSKNDQVTKKVEATPVSAAAGASGGPHPASKKGLLRTMNEMKEKMSELSNVLENRQAEGRADREQDRKERKAERDQYRAENRAFLTEMIHSSAFAVKSRDRTGSSEPPPVSDDVKGGEEGLEHNEGDSEHEDDDVE